MGYLQISEVGQHKGFTYALAEQEDYQQLQTSITTVLDTILKDLEAQISSPSAQLPGKPVKPKPSKQKQEPAQ